MNMNSDSDSILVDVKNVSRSYGPIIAVDDISFQVKRGQVLGFLGPNGAGKSTTMQMLTGNLAPSQGQILINGADILDRPRQAKSQLGYLPEQPPVYQEMTVDEYLQYCAQLNRVSRDRIKAAMEYAKEKCGLTQVGKRLIGNLSKGFQQRTGIAQAILHNPAIVILDEPTVGLDPIQIREIRNLIRDLRGDHSVILSTHILPEVQTICDHVQIINNGKLVFSESISSLQDHLDTKSIIVAFAQTLTSAQLEGLSVYGDITSLSPHKYKINYENTLSVDDLLKHSLAEKWQLREVYPDRMSLEHIFVQLTTSDEGQNESSIPGEQTV